MSDRSSLRVPSYRLHRQSGQAIVTLSDGFGQRRDMLLGRHGTAESRQEYARVIAEWEARGRHLLPPGGASTDLSVNELIVAYWEHFAQNYRQPDGSPSRTLTNIADAVRPLKNLYGHTAARDFGPRALKAVQQHLVDQGLCRSTINSRIGRIKSLFRWAESEELVPPSTLHALQTVRGLARGRTTARESSPIRPVSPGVVEATLPLLSPTVADMVRVQLLTGMRSGELVLMRTIDLDTAGTIWLYRPGSDQGRHGTHKTAHLGLDRVIAIGPRGQQILRRYLKAELWAFLFSPQEVVLQLRTERRKKRRTRVQPSQQDRRKRKPTVRPGTRYTVGSYRTAIKRACLRAKVEPWFPHRLRHSAATEVRKQAGLDAARAVLGHRSPVITEVYAELDMAKAVEVAARLG